MNNNTNSTYLTNEKEIINYMAFNHDFKCFVLATNFGFKIFKTQPFEQVINRHIPGGCNFVESFFGTNIMAFIGTGECSSYPKNKLIFWNDYS